MKANEPLSELTILRALERKVREMFAYTGWEDDCDDDAAACVMDVRATLHWVDDSRRILELPVCEHEWVSAVNEVVTSGEICRKCFALR